MSWLEWRIGLVVSGIVRKQKKNVLLRAPRLAVSKPGVGLGSVFLFFLHFIRVLLECKESVAELLPQCGLTCTSSFIIENAAIG